MIISHHKYLQNLYCHQFLSIFVKYFHLFHLKKNLNFSNFIEYKRNFNFIYLFYQLNFNFTTISKFSTLYFLNY